ncbi:MAG: Gfo/Idh/MocA family oxidoreductase [Rhizobiaceae bacterium]|nr:Gfo/Idh/MocA family oxidoreductase [Rhizobiaceae bacterium]
MFRWGILSTALIAREQMIPAIQQSDNGVVAAIASRDGERARALADRFGVPQAFGSYDELLASAEIDGIYIPLPTSHHVEWAIRAADAGKHVLVEKPLALKAADIAPVIAARDRNRVLVCEAFMVTHHPQWVKVAELLRGGAIGRLRHVQGAFSYYNVDPANMRNIAALGGGALPDIGVYPVVTTRLVTGQEPARVLASIRRDPRFGTDVYSVLRAEFEGFDLTFYVSTQMADRQAMVFHGDRGFIEVASPFNAGLYDDHRVTLHDASHQAMTTLRFPGAQQYRLEADAFVRAARGSGERVFTLEESILNQKVIDAFFRAGDSGGWESV